MKWFITGLVLISILIISCGEPTTPETIGGNVNDGGYKVVSRTVLSGFAQDVEVVGNKAYLAQGEGGLAIIDISDKNQPQVLSNTFERIKGYCTKIALKDSVVFLAAGTFGANIINAADPSNPIVTASNIGIKPARSFYIYADYLFAATSSEGIRMSDISYPFEPDVQGAIETPGYARGLTSTADSSLLLAACGEMGFATFDISNFTGGFGSYQMAGWMDTPGYAEEVVVKEGETLAILACGSGGVQIVDFSDSANYKLVGSFDTGGYAKEVLCHDDRVYVTTEKRGLQILDISEPNSPRLLGVVDSEYALGLDMDENYLYVADEKEGLIIIQIP